MTKQKYVNAIKKIFFKPKYLAFLFTIFLITLTFWTNYKFTKSMDINGDGSLIRYIIINNIQNWKDYSIKYGINQKIFYPNMNNAAYTDNFYLYSLIAAPFYLITHNLFVDVFIFFIHVYLYSIGLFLLGHFFIKNVFKNKKLYIVLPLLVTWLVFLPSFVDRHLQLIFVGPFTLALFYLMKWIQTKKLQYFGFMAFWELIQMSVGLYLFVFQLYIILIIFGIAIIIYKNKIFYFINNYVTKKTLKIIIIFLIIYIITFVLLYYQNYQLHLDLQIKRDLKEVVKYSADAVLSYIVPVKTGTFERNLFRSVLPGLVNLWHPEAHLYLGIIGNITILLISILVMWKILTDSSGDSIKDRLLYIVFGVILSIYIFTLGPYLHLLGILYKIPMPYILLHKIIIFQGIRVVSRINVFLGPFFLYLILYLWNYVYKEAKVKWLLNIIFLLFILFSALDIIYLDYWAPSTNFAQKYFFKYVAPLYVKESNYLERERKIYTKLNSFEGVVLLELPTSYVKYGWDARYLQFHIYHDKFEVNGYSGIFRDNTLNIIHQIYSAQDNERLTKSLCDNNIDLVLVHKHLIPLQNPEETKRLYDILESNYQPVYEDNDHAIFYIDKLTVCPHAK